MVSALIVGLYCDAPLSRSAGCIRGQQPRRLHRRLTPFSSLPYTLPPLSPSQVSGMAVAPPVASVASSRVASVASLETLAAAAAADGSPQPHQVMLLSKISQSVSLRSRNW